MSEGYCTDCPGRCHWSKHVSQSFWYELYEEEQVRTSADLKARYDTATQGKSMAEAVVSSLEAELKQVESDVLSMESQVRGSLNRLDEIALKPNPLAEVEYIDLLIEGERQEQKPGWTNRVQAYEVVKEKAKLMAGVMAKEGPVFGSLAGEGACSVKWE